MSKRKRDGLYRRENDILAFRYKDRGRWKEKYTGTSDRAEAKKFKADFEQDLEDGCMPTEMADWRLDQAATWWNDFRRKRISPATFNCQRYMLKHFSRILGNKQLHEIANLDLDNYVSKRLDEGIAHCTINKELMLWSMILRKAKLWLRLSGDYQPLTIHASDIGQAITRAQLQHLAGIAAQDEDWEAAFLGSVLAANTGLRGGEIKTLRIESLNLEKRQLKIRRRDAKSDASARSVDLNQDAMEAAARLLLRAQIHGASKPEHYLMPKCLSRIQHGQEKGKRGYDPSQHQVSWDTAWASLTAKAGLPSLRFHDLRHSFISHMVEKGIPLGVIQSMVGHISARMLRHYTHVSSGAQRRAVATLDSEPLLTADLTGPQATIQ